MKLLVTEADEGLLCTEIICKVCGANFKAIWPKAKGRDVVSLRTC